MELFDAEVEEINGLKLQLTNLNNDLKAKTAKVEQLTSELSIMRERRDELEKIVKNASSMLMDGRLSDDAYCAHKRELAALYQSIDDKDSLLGIYEKAVDVDYTKKYTEINGNIQRMKTKLLAKYAQKIAIDIVSKSELQLKQLLAILPGNAMRTAELRGLDLGDALIFALNHEQDGNKKRNDPDENKKLYQNVLSELGV